MMPLEFVLIFHFGDVIILTTIGDGRSDTNAVCAVITVGLMHPFVLFVHEQMNVELLRNGGIDPFQKTARTPRGAAGFNILRVETV
jgi:hypothetical protein